MTFEIIITTTGPDNIRILEDQEEPAEEIHALENAHEIENIDENAQVLEQEHIDEVLHQALIDEVLEEGNIDEVLEQEPDHNEIDFFHIFDNSMDMANNFVEEECQTIERDDLNEAFYGGTQQEAVIAEVIDRWTQTN